MKRCLTCNVGLENQAAFCHACGSKQVKSANLIPVKEDVQSAAPALMVLCILSIIGSVLGILRGFFYEWLQSVYSGHSNKSFYIFGIFSIVANLGTLVGAISMLKRNFSGYVIYMIFQVMGILVIIFRTLYFNSENSKHYDHDNVVWTLTLFMAAAFVVPSVVFMILYTTMGKKYLK